MHGLRNSMNHPATSSGVLPARKCPKGRGINPCFTIKLLALLTLLTLLTACKRPHLPPPIVLFDHSHGQRSEVENIRLNDLSKFAALFQEQGFQVQTNQKSLSAEILEKIDALIISGPSTPLTKKELENVIKYLQNGGQLCIMLDTAAPATNLLTALQVAVAYKLVHERQNITTDHDQTFSLKNLPNHPLTKSLSSFKIYGACPLKTAFEANIIAKTSKTAWVDLDGDNKLGKNDAQQSFAVMITGQLGHGHFVIIGDDALFTNQFLTESNLQLGRNLAIWFKEGSYY